MDMGIHDGHRERKKRQFLTAGPASFADHELLELALFYAIPRRDTNETAHLLLKRFESLSGVLEADVWELQSTPGVGESAAILLKLLTAVRHRADCGQTEGVIISSVEEAGEYFIRLFRGEKRERLYIMCLDGKGKVVYCRSISDGSVNMASTSVRLVVEHALRPGTAAVLLAHNHPNGVALPSRADQHMTLQAHSILTSLGIRLLDHIVVADGDYVSMADSGMFPG